MRTAVEWLIEQILEIPLDNATNAAHLKKLVNKVSVFEKALEMEKKQIIDAYDIGVFQTEVYGEMLSGTGKDYYDNFKKDVK